MADRQLRLGKKPYVKDDRDFTFAALAEASSTPLPNPPLRFGHGLDFPDWLMLGNGPDDSVYPGFQGAGCCVLSDAGHQTMLTTKMGGHPATITGKEVIEAYSDVTGYVLDDPGTDMGTYIRDALVYRRRTGMPDASGNRHKIGAFVSIDPKNWNELMKATFVFTSVSIGFEVPDWIWDLWDNDEVWDVISEDYEIIGGHDICHMGRRARNDAGFISWAKRVGVTRDFYETFNDEAWAIIFPEELVNGKTERGYDISQLNEWLKQLP